MDPTQATVRLLIVLTSRIQKSGAGDTNFSNEKGHFSLANQNDQTGHNGPPSMVHGYKYSSRTSPKWSVPLGF